MGKKNKNKRLRQQKRAEKRAIKSEQRKSELEIQKKETENRSNIITIPTILGADFDETKNDINEIRKQIELLPKSTYKKRILFLSEAAYLNTGFSTYVRWIMDILNKTGKYEIAHMGSYGAPASIDPRAKELPYKYYHVLPSNSIEEAEYRKEYQTNQFGKWKANYVFADFKPDIVFDCRDFWMQEWINKNPLRGNFLYFLLACVDGYPQKWEWLADYSRADGLYTYSWFGKKVLEEQSRCLLSKTIKLPQLYVKNVIQPGVDIKVFKPQNKAETKKIFGIPPHLRFIGTVMRNQPRKLFTRIIDSFRIFKQKYPIESKDVLLLLHTSIPDVGWDIPESVRENGIDEFVVYSYLCSSCGLLAVSTFCGGDAHGNSVCPKCNTQSFHTPNTQYGYTDEAFSMIYNLMDIYIQGSVAEGDGMPVNEAKACGIPCLVSDYSALYEKARNGGAMSIKNETIYTEHETMQWRSMFDREDLAEKLSVLMGNEQKRQKLSEEARQCAEKYYNWDLCAAKWEYEIDKVVIKDRKNTWEKSIEIKTMTEHSPPDLPNNRQGYKEWLEWCYKHILGRQGIDPQGLQHWTNILENAQDKNSAKTEVEKHFRKMIDKENESKKIIQNPEIANTDPIQKTRMAIEEIENAEKEESNV